MACSKSTFRRKVTAIIGNRGQLWTSTSFPPSAKPSFGLSRDVSVAARADRRDDFLLLCKFGEVRDV